MNPEVTTRTNSIALFSFPVELFAFRSFHMLSSFLFNSLLPREGKSGRKLTLVMFDLLSFSRTYLVGYFHSKRKESESAEAKRDFAKREAKTFSHSRRQQRKNFAEINEIFFSDLKLFFLLLLASKSF
jgi:hypothetical protein